MRTMKYFITLSFLLISLSGIAQDAQKEQNDSLAMVAKPAGYPGGEKAMNNYLIQNIQYPESATYCNASAKIKVSFIVEMDGRLSDVQVFSKTCKVNGPDLVRPSKKRKKRKPVAEKPIVSYDCDTCCYEMAKEAVRVISLMPNWEPASLKNKAVRMRFVLPISFEIY